MKQRLVQTWEGFISSIDYRTAIDVTVEFSEKFPVKTIISDTLNMGVVKPEDTDYAGSMIPKLFDNGLEVMAFIIPENIFTQLALKQFSEKENRENIVYFKSIIEAQDWLDKN